MVTTERACVHLDPPPENGGAGATIYATDFPNVNGPSTWVVTTVINSNGYYVTMETASHTGHYSYKIYGYSFSGNAYSASGANLGALDKDHNFNFNYAQTDTVDLYTQSTHNARYAGEDLLAKSAGGHSVRRPPVNPPLEQDSPASGGGGSPGGGDLQERCWDRYVSHDNGLTWEYQYTWCENVYLMSKVGGEGEDSPRYQNGKDATVVILGVESLIGARARIISDPTRLPRSLSFLAPLSPRKISRRLSLCCTR